MVFNYFYNQSTKNKRQTEVQAQTFYTVKGVLPQGFVGHIAYNIVLPKALTDVRLKFVFDKKNLLEDETAYS